MQHRVYNRVLGVVLSVVEGHVQKVVHSVLAIVSCLVQVIAGSKAVFLRRGLLLFLCHDFFPDRSDFCHVRHPFLALCPEVSFYLPPSFCPDLYSCSLLVSDVEELVPFLCPAWTPSLCPELRVGKPHAYLEVRVVRPHAYLEVRASSLDSWISEELPPASWPVMVPAQS